MTPEELADAVAALRAFDAEVRDVEAKSAARGLPRSLRSTASAFSNTAGGIVLLGIDEEAGFAAVDLEDPGKIASDLAAMLTDQFEPPIRALVSPHEFEGCRIVVAEIPQLPFDQKPCYYKGAGISAGSWTRTGASNRRLTPYEVQILLSSRGQPRDDERAVPGTTTRDLDPDALEGFIKRLKATRPNAYAGLSENEVLRHCRVVVDDENGVAALSRAGLLALGSHPQEWFPQMNLTFVHLPDDAPASAGQSVRFLDNVAIDQRQSA